MNQLKEFGDINIPGSVQDNYIPIYLKEINFDDLQDNSISMMPIIWDKN